MPARNSAALVAAIPRSTVGSSRNAPRNLPIGVRAPSRMTARSTGPILSRVRAPITAAGTLGFAMPRIVREHSVLTLFSLGYLVSFTVFGLATGRRQTITHLLQLAVTFAFIAAVHERVR